MLWLFKISGIKLDFFIKIRISCWKRHIWPPGVLMHGLTPWSDGIFSKNSYYASILIRLLLWLFKISEVKLEHFYQNTHILPKTSHLTPRGAYVWTYPLEWWYFFRRTINMLQFKYDFCYDYFRFRGSNSYIFIKIRIFCQKRHIWPPGVLMYGLTPWCDGIFFEELLICFNFSMTFVMIF